MGDQEGWAQEGKKVENPTLPGVRPRGGILLPLLYFALPTLWFQMWELRLGEDPC